MGDDGCLLVGLLLGAGVALREALVARQIEPRVGEGCLVLCFLCDGLVELGLVRGRIDAREHVALLNGLALGELNRHQPAFDLRADDDGVERLHAADALTQDRHGLLHNGCDGDGG